MKKVLVVDDDPGLRAALEARFLRRGWQVETASCAAEGLEKFRRTMPPLLLTDVRMSGEDGLWLMRSARSLVPNTAVILLTAFASIPEAVSAMKDGACDYLVKPVAFEQLEQAAERILLRVQTSIAPDLCGHAPAWLRSLQRAQQAAASDADVLIEGESGTGKELVARLIHRQSTRRNRAFVAVNCAAFPESLLESELFGHVKGAFTGADIAKPGKFELAHGGTLLLDEVGEMPLLLQPKLLRALQEREFDRLGDTRPIRVDLRVIATTNRSLAQMVSEGQFRADLFYRLNVIPLSLPPLRERAGDIKELADYFVHLYTPAGKSMHLSPALLARMESYRWPGNVRELANCIRRLIALAPGPELADTDMNGPDFLVDDRLPDSSTCCIQPGVSLGDMERKLVEVTLQATGGNRSRAAEMLGVSLRTIRNKVRSYGLPDWSSYVHD